LDSNVVHNSQALFTDCAAAHLHNQDLLSQHTVAAADCRFYD